MEVGETFSKIMSALLGFLGCKWEQRCALPPCLPLPPSPSSSFVFQIFVTSCATPHASVLLEGCSFNLNVPQHTLLSALPCM